MCCQGAASILLAADCMNGWYLIATTKSTSAWYIGLRLAGSIQSSCCPLWRLANESTVCNNASTEPKTQRGVFHLSASVACQGWGARSLPCLHKAGPSNNKRGSYRVNLPHCSKKRGARENAQVAHHAIGRAAASCEGGWLFGHSLKMVLQCGLGALHTFNNISSLPSYRISSAGASVATPPASPPPHFAFV